MSSTQHVMSSSQTPTDQQQQEASCQSRLAAHMEPNVAEYVCSANDGWQEIYDNVSTFLTKTDVGMKRLAERVSQLESMSDTKKEKEWLDDMRKSRDAVMKLLSDVEETKLLAVDVASKLIIANREVEEAERVAKSQQDELSKQFGTVQAVAAMQNQPPVLAQAPPSQAILELTREIQELKRAQRQPTSGQQPIALVADQPQPQQPPAEPSALEKLESMLALQPPSAPTQQPSSAATPPTAPQPPMPLTGNVSRGEMEADYLAAKKKMDEVGKQIEQEIVKATDANFAQLNALNEPPVKPNTSVNIELVFNGDKRLTDESAAAVKDYIRKLIAAGNTAELKQFVDGDLAANKIAVTNNGTPLNTTTLSSYTEASSPSFVGSIVDKVKLFFAPSPSPPSSQPPPTQPTPPTVTAQQQRQLTEQVTETANASRVDTEAEAARVNNAVNELSNLLLSVMDNNAVEVKAISDELARCKDMKEEDAQKLKNLIQSFEAEKKETAKKMAEEIRALKSESDVFRKTHVDNIAALEEHASALAKEHERANNESTEVISAKAMEITELSKKTETLQQELNALKAECEQTKKAGADTAAKLTAETEKNSALQKELDALRAQCEQVKKDNENLRSQSELTRKLGDDRLGDERKKNEEIVNTLNKALEAERKAVSEKTAEITKLSTEITELKASHGLQLTSSTEPLNKRITELQAENESLKKSLAENSTQADSTNKSLTDQLTTLRAEAEATKTALTGNIGTLTTENQSLKNSLAESTTRVDSLTEQLAALRSENQTLTERLASVGNELSQLRLKSATDVNDTRLYESLEAELNGVIQTGNCDGKIEFLKEVKAGLSKLRENKGHIDYLLGIARKERDEAEKKRDELQATVTALQTEIEEKNRKLTRLQVDLDNAKLTVSDLDKKLDAANSSGVKYNPVQRKTIEHMIGNNNPDNNNNNNNNLKASFGSRPMLAFI